jgi:hypothetical protein
MVPLNHILKPTTSSQWLDRKNLIFCVFFLVIAENCDSYYDFNDNFLKSERCTISNPYCCGFCSKRVCCSNQTRRLDQTKCFEKCYAYYVNSNLQLTKVCDTSLDPTNSAIEKDQYCCGSCTDRRCCSNLLFRLNQSSCDVPTSIQSKQSETYEIILF